MIILSDALTEKPDEGALRVATSLTKKIKQADPSTTIISYGRKPEKTDIHLKLNKFFLNRSLISVIRKKREEVLYIPFASNTTGTLLRVFILSLFAKHGLRVIFVLRYPMGRWQRFLMKKSKAEIVALSKEAYEYYSSMGFKTVYLKTGVDTERFVPVDQKTKVRLKEKYKIPKDKKVVLHVGHLKKGRNVDKMLTIDEEKYVYLVVSSVTEKEKDQNIRSALNRRPNTRVEDAYLERIEEIYQMSDVYLFPVTESEECIDVPLSVMEAASCDLPIVTTLCGELKELKGKEGFFFLNSMDQKTLNATIDEALQTENCHSRQSVLEYDWDNAVRFLLEKHS